MSTSPLISTLQEYNRLGIPTQIDYKKQCLLLPQMSPKAAPMSPKMSPKAVLMIPKQQRICSHLVSSKSCK